MAQEKAQNLVSDNLHVEITQPKISGNLVDLLPCLQPPEIREKLEQQSHHQQSIEGVELEEKN